jgi:hypothetical protein
MHPQKKLDLIGRVIILSLHAFQFHGQIYVKQTLFFIKDILQLILGTFQHSLLLALLPGLEIRQFGGGIGLFAVHLAIFQVTLEQSAFPDGFLELFLSHGVIDDSSSHGLTEIFSLAPFLGNFLNSIRAIVLDLLDSFLFAERGLFDGSLEFLILPPSISGVVSLGVVGVLFLEFINSLLVFL